MKKVYVDNSATSFPKAPGVSDAIKNYIDNTGCNINRGGYESSYNLSLDILEARKLLCWLFRHNEPRNVVFTPGITYSINMIVQGFLKDGDHVITTSMEHNGVMRPLNGRAYDIATCNPDGSLDPQEIEKLISTKTKAVIMTHASNVCGTVLPICDVAKICTNHGIKLIVDSAQTAGILDINMTHIDALAFTAHKGLLAPQGLGGFIVNEEMAKKIAPVITGGTGSKSHDLTQPDIMPDKFEPGTLNIPGIIGLKAALEYIVETGVRNIHEKELRLTERFLSGINEIKGVSIIGKKDTVGRISVVSLDFKDKDNADVAAILDQKYGIMTRCGLHCSPMAHKTLGTYPRGTVRFSFGHFNSYEDVDYVLSAIKNL
ncbi:MAG: aminotransferase class V-fold PLP-dependent enzyme [Defluviitaleaceae bacterium]|nr:aminotransferase class V-fold PLP-dependent enzyme [Defluviitaleaceae bacterium]